MKHSKLFAGLLMAIAFALVASIGFTGCTPTKPDSAPLTEHQQIEVVCTTIATGYDTAGVLNARSPLSAKAQDRLRALPAITDKVCTNIPNSWLEVAPEFTKAAGEVAILSTGGTPP